MIGALIWTLICIPGLVVWTGIAIETLAYWRSFKREDPALAHTYFRELLGDATIFAVLGFWTLIGALAIVAPHLDGIGQIAIIIGLYSGPAGLTLLGFWRYWRRHRTK